MVAAVKRNAGNRMKHFIKDHGETDEEDGSTLVTMLLDRCLHYSLHDSPVTNRSEQDDNKYFLNNMAHIRVDSVYRRKTAASCDRITKECK
ncbi:hypothetical protein LSAT2_025386 [Lamellibrachia satsuma]|nr:hypothetical protein LSAT2_025386 [Lamellibrachia satsuma]